MTSVRFDLTVRDDPVKLITEHAAKYVSEYCFDLNIPTKIGIAELMALLVSLYQRLENYDNSIHYEIIPKPLEMIVCERFSSVALGGTFDYLHAGHLLLLTYSRMLLAEDGELIVGVTSEIMLSSKKNKEFLQSIFTRKQRVQSFLQRLATNKPRVFELTDPYGPTITEKDVKVMVVTRETEAAGPKANQIRSQRGFPPLILFVMELVEDAKESSSKLSSTLIRKRLMERNSFTGEMRQQYRKMWSAACEKLLVAAGWKESLNQDLMQLFSAEGDSLFERYSQPWRHYHTNEHILSMLEEYRTDPAYKVQLTPKEEAALLLSVFYHDSIYLPNRNDNEDQSVQLLKKFLVQVEHAAKIQLQDVIQLTHELISMTKGHKPQNRLQEVLNDLDMSILGAPPTRYERYAGHIKQEYIREFPNEATFKAKRADFLKGLNSKFIFKLHPEKEQLTQQNIAWEISQLSAPAQL